MPLVNCADCRLKAHEDRQKKGEQEAIEIQMKKRMKLEKRKRESEEGFRQRMNNL